MGEIINWIGFVITFFFIWRSEPLMKLTNFIIMKTKPRRSIRYLIECDFCLTFWISIPLSIITGNPILIPIGLLVNSLLNKIFN